MENQQQKIYHYVYLVTDGIQSYIGSRTCHVPPEEDIDYFGSSTDLEFRKRAKLANRKFILKQFRTREEAFIYEANLQKKNWKVAENQVFANKGYVLLEDHYDGCSIPVGFKWSDKARKRFSEYKKNNPTILSSETLEIIALKRSLISSDGLYRSEIKLRKYNNFSKLEKFILLHHTGLSFYGTLSRFIDIFDVTYPGASELFIGTVNTHRGWKVVQRPEQMLVESSRDSKQGDKTGMPVL